MFVIQLHTSIVNHTKLGLQPQFTNTDSMAGFLLETEGCPSPRVGHAALTLGNAFIVFGGDTKVTDTDTPDDNLYLLNTSTLKWTVANPKGSRPAGRYGHSLSTVGSKLFVFGGQLDDYFFDDLVCFDLTKLRSPECRWTTIEPADGVSPPPRTNHTVVTYQDKLYMYGGTDGQLWYSDTWCFDPVTSLWTQLNCSGFIPTPSEGHAATVVNDIMYVFGGRSSKGDDLGVLSALKLTSKRWFTFENMGQAPAPRSGHSMTAYSNHKVLVMGGESHDQDDTHVYVLDTSRIKYPPKAVDVGDTSVQSVQSISSLSSQNAPQPMSPGVQGLQSGRQSPVVSQQQGLGGPHPPAPGAVPLPGMVGPGAMDRSFDRSTVSDRSVGDRSVGDRSVGDRSVDRSDVDQSVGSIDDEKYERGYMQPGEVDGADAGASVGASHGYMQPGQVTDDGPAGPAGASHGSGVGGAVAGAAAGVAAAAAGLVGANHLSHRSSNLGSNSEEFESADDGRPVSSEAEGDEDLYGSPSAKIPAAWPEEPKEGEDEPFLQNEASFHDASTPRDERDHPGYGQEHSGQDQPGYGQEDGEERAYSDVPPSTASSSAGATSGAAGSSAPAGYDDSDYSQHTTPQHSAVASPVNYTSREADSSSSHGISPGVAAASAGVAGVTAGVAGMNIHQKANNVKIEPEEHALQSDERGVDERGLDSHVDRGIDANTTVDSEGDVQDVIEQLKATNSWYESELTVAKQSGFTPSKNPVVDIEQVRRRSLRYSRDQGASLSERDILVQALVEVKQELQNVKSDVARQSEEASQKLKALNDENQQLRAHLDGEGEGGSRALGAGAAGAGVGAGVGALAGSAASPDLAAKHAELQKKYNLLVGSGGAPAGDGTRDLADAAATPGNVHQLLKQEQNKNASLEYELETLKDELATTQTKWKDVGGTANEHVTALQAAGAALAASQSQHALLQRDLDSHKTARSSADEEVLQLKRQLEDAERRAAQAEEELEKEQQLGAHAREQNEHSTQAMTGGIDKILAMWGGSALIGGAAGFAGGAAGNGLTNGSRGVGGDGDGVDGDEAPSASGINAHPQFVSMQKQVDGANKLHQMHREAAEQAAADLSVAQSQVEELKATLLKSEQENHELLAELEELKGHVTEHRRQLETHEQTRSTSETQALRLKELEAELAATLDTHRTELDNLEVTHRSKLGEMEKAKKDSLAYMQNSDLALRKTREELSRSKEQISQLQDELSELQIRGKGGAPQGHEYDDDDDDDDEKFGSHQLELQLRDTRATLVVVEQERDELRVTNADLRKKAITNVQDMEKYKRRYQRLKQRGGEDSFGESEFDQTHTSGFESPRQ